MSITGWKDLLRLNHEIIDRQHLELFDIVNALCDAVRQGDGASEKLLGHTIARLCEYARTHFVAEEQLMVEAGYPGLQRHKRAHDTLLSMLDELEARLRFGDSKMASQLMSFLVSEWLGDHIVVEDKRFASFVESPAEPPHFAAKKTTPPLPVAWHLNRADVRRSPAGKLSAWISS